MPPPTRSTEPANRSIPLRFTERELEKIDALRGPDESRSVYVRRLLDEAFTRADSPEGWLPPLSPDPPLRDLGPLEDEPADERGPPAPAADPAGALVVSLAALLSRSGASRADVLRALRRAIDEELERP